jgi:hypothetical protein
LFGTAVQGVAGAKQDAETKAAQWDFATQWSCPKIETLGLVVPGLFGYRMDTPKNMPEFLQDTYKGGNYWGAVGRDPAWDRYFAGGKQGPPPQGSMRFSGGGSYAGVFVVLVALWAIAQSFRRKDSVFSLMQRRFIWFWAAAMLISLLLAFGRFAPFYQFLYMLPYFSTIRNPCKFLSVFNWALVIVFSYGIHGLSRRYMETAVSNSLSALAMFKPWWKKAVGFDRKWTLGCFVAIVVSLIGWLVYATSQPQLAAYLQTVQFPEDLAGQIAAFSVRQVGWFVLFLALSVAGLAFAFSGAFAGKRSKLGGFLLGCVLVADLGRADLPYIIHWDYEQKYEVGPVKLNPVVKFLSEKPYEQRVALLPLPAPQQMEWFCGQGGMYKIEWSQQLFPYYNILQLDIIQMARRTEDFMAFETALSYRNTSETMFLFARRWELTSTRYLLGSMVTTLSMGNVPTLTFLNNGLDAGKGRFRIVKQFELEPKPGLVNAAPWEQWTAVENPDSRYTLPEFPAGRYALFEFTGALPHVALYSHWQVSTNDDATLKQWLAELKPYLPKEAYGILTNLNVVDQAALKTLSDANFDPQQTVLVPTPLPVASAATNQNAGEVKFESYRAAHIVFTAHAETNAVLMLNDHYDPMWRVTVDGKPAELLRCNYIMRGVLLTPGTHTVDFRFQPPLWPGYVTLTAIGLGILLCGLLIYSERRVKEREQSPEPLAEKSSPLTKRR